MTIEEMKAYYTNATFTGDKVFISPNGEGGTSFFTFYPLGEKHIAVTLEQLDKLCKGILRWNEDCTALDEQIYPAFEGGL